MKLRKIKKAMKNNLCGDILSIKTKNNHYAIFCNQEGNIFYIGIMNSNYYLYYKPIKIKIENYSDIIEPNQILPTQLASYFIAIFKLSPYRDRKKLEDLISNIFLE